jgi:uncharacterized protein (TIGR02001 family)
MKNTIRAFAAATLALLAPLAAHAQDATVSANAGYLSQYYYRGILQKTSSASAGLDVGIGPVYLGTWAADVGSGAEVDLYGGVGVTVGAVALSVGGTGYFYTGTFDDNYYEGNVSAGIGPVTLEAAIGSYDTDPESVDYQFVSGTIEQSGLFATVGTFLGSDEFYANEGMYAEAGYGFTAGEMDFTISGILNNAELSGEENDDGDDAGELTFVFGISKTFEIR